MALADAITSLQRRGWSQRRIARELSVDRQTVARYVQASQEAAKPANAPPGSGAPAAEVEQPKLAFAPIGSELNCEATLAGDDKLAGPGQRGRGSDCQAYRQVILDKLELGLSGQRIYQDLVAEHGFGGSYYSVRRFLRRLGQARPLPFRRLECAAGEEAQVDFGSGAPIRTAEGKRRRTHVFRIVLSHSRKAYSEAVYRQTTENFIRCLENAFGHFGGVPQRLVLDNLRAAVTKADWFDPELNPKVRSFAQHYGIVLWPTRPYTPRHKGKVEKGVDYVQDNALKGHVFACLDDENAHLRHWEASVADTRVHGTTRKQVGKHFQEVERPALQPLPTERFPCFDEAQRRAHRDGHIEVARAYYSVPPEYVGRQVWVRWDTRLVRIFDAQMKPLSVHVRQEPGRFSTHKQHIVTEKINSVERGADWLLEKISRIGRQCTLWSEALLRERGVESVRVLQGLLALTKTYSSRQLERACEIAHSYSAYRLRTIRTLLKRQEDQKQGTFEFLDEHEIIRPLADYDWLIQRAFADALERKEDADHAANAQ
jgi:transposase